MPTESGVGGTENQNGPIEEMFSEDKFQLEEGLKKLDNLPPNPLEELQQRMAQLYNTQQENPTGSVENVSSDKGEAMAESATVEAKQEVAIEKVVAEASQIGPDFGNGVKAELQQTAKESLKMKIEAKVYDLLTNIERKIGQGIATQIVREKFSEDLRRAKEWKTGKVWHSGLDKASQYEEGRGLENDVALGKRNLKDGVESVTFVPGGEVIRSISDEDGFVLEKPLVHTGGSFDKGSRASSSLDSGAGSAGFAIEVNPVISTLEKWRTTLRERQVSVNGAKQLVSNYGSAR